MDVAIWIWALLAVAALIVLRAVWFTLQPDAGESRPSTGQRASQVTGDRGLTATIGAAAFAGLVGIAVSYVNAEAGRNLERQKWCQARDDEERRELLSAVVDFVGHLNRGVLRAQALTAIGVKDEQPPLPAAAFAFEADMHRIYVDIYSAQARIALLSKEWQNMVVPLISTFAKLENDLSNRVRGLDPTPPEKRERVHLYVTISKQFGAVGAELQTRTAGLLSNEHADTTSVNRCLKAAQ